MEKACYVKKLNMANVTTIDDRLWEKVAPHLPKMKKRQGSAGRPPLWSWREILEAIIWILRTGAQWSALPECFPPKSTVHYRFLILVRSGFFQHLNAEIAQELYDKGVLDLSECYIDGMFVSGKRGGEAIGKTKRGKGSKIMAICDKNGRPAGITVTSASPHEVTLVHATIDNMFVDESPEHLVGDGAYDSDPLDQELQKAGIEMIAPHKKNRVAPPTQDGRAFRRYKRRWKIERFNSWVQNYRRVLVRYERSLSTYLAFVLFACAMILQKAL